MNKYLGKKIILLFIALIPLAGVCYGIPNKYFIKNGDDYEKIPFIFSGNQIIIKLRVNNSEPLNFILDSGVKTPILIDGAKLNTSNAGNMRRIFIQGLGNGEPSEALIAYKNKINIGKYIVNNNQTILVMLEDLFYLSNRLGYKISGIIGFDIFRDFVVEINYDYKYIKLHNPVRYIYSTGKKYVTKKLSFNKGKPYINLELEISNKNIVTVKLLVDTGGSDALWLFHKSHKDINIPNNFIPDFLGRGLSGDIYGKRSRISKLYIDNLVLKDVTASYPDSTSVSFVMMHKERNGSVGGAALSRFRLIIDYTNKKITFRRGFKFRHKFRYNMSGIEIHMPYPSLPIYQIHSIRANSPAEKAGVKVGDVINYINYINASSLTLPEIMHKFQSKDKSRIRLSLSRNGEKIEANFRLRKDI